MLLSWQTRLGVWGSATHKRVKTTRADTWVDISLSASRDVINSHYGGKYFTVILPLTFGSVSAPAKTIHFKSRAYGGLFSVWYEGLCMKMLVAQQPCEIDTSGMGGGVGGGGGKRNVQEQKLDWWIVYLKLAFTPTHRVPQRFDFSHSYVRVSHNSLPVSMYLRWVWLFYR